MSADLPTVSSEPCARFPTFRKMYHWAFNWRTIGRVLVALAGLATLIGLFYAEENWRGKHAWLKYKHELEAKGEKLDFKDYIPAPVPDDQNFAMTPLLAPLFDFNPKPLKEGQSIWRDTNGYNRAISLFTEFSSIQPKLRYSAESHARMEMTDLAAWAEAFTAKTNAAAPNAQPSWTRAEAASKVLQSLKKYDAVLDELRAASQRPYARFNVRYDDESAPSILLPHLAVLENAALIFQLRASAELALDHTDKAWSDTKLALYLADAVKDEPFLISELLRTALVQISLRPVWEGLALHKWSDAQLSEIQDRLRQVKLLTDWGMRGERAMDILTVDQLLALGDTRMLGNVLDSPAYPYNLMPSGWFYQNEIVVVHLYQDFILPSFDVSNQRIYASSAITNDALVNKALSSGFLPFTIFAKLLVPSLTSCGAKLAAGQTRVNEAIVACALERYRLSQRHYPESLVELSPRFLEKAPHDVITGEPLMYRRADNGQFILYSVGWPVGTTKVGRFDFGSEVLQGAWVWQYPEK